MQQQRATKSMGEDGQRGVPWRVLPLVRPPRACCALDGLHSQLLSVRAQSSMQPLAAGVIQLAPTCRHHYSL